MFGRVAIHKPLLRLHSISLHQQYLRSFTMGSKLSDTPTYVSPGNVHQMLSKYDTLMLDCDGVLWGTDSHTKFPGTADCIHKLRNMGKHVLFVTNNSLFSRADLLDKFNELGEFDAPESDVISANWAVGIYLKEILKIRGKCYTMGISGLGEELDNAGIQHFGIGPDNDPITRVPGEYLKHEYREDVEAVVIGYDHHFNSNKLAKAGTYLLNPRCHYIATSVNEVSIRIGANKDHLMPLTGAYVAALTAASKREPYVIGKPSTLLMDCIKSCHPKVDLARTLMIGDSIKSDIGFARNTGVDCAAVLTGVATSETIEKLQQEKSTLVPDYVISSIDDLGKWL